MAAENVLDPYESMIFVSIPSYRDPECAKTIADMYRNAKNPARLVFGVCEQNLAGDASVVPPHLASYVGAGSQVRVHSMSAHDAKGPSYARAIIEADLYSHDEGIELFLQIDSHTRAVKFWDVDCVRDVIACEKQRNGDPRFVLTTCPDNYERGSEQIAGSSTTMGRTILDIERFSDMHRDAGNYMSFHSWDPASLLPMHFKTKFLGGGSSQYHRTAFFSGNFVLGRSEAWQQVPNNISLPYLFTGEEQSMAVRLYTHGYDMYTPKKMLLYSHTERAYRPVYWELYRDKYNATPPEICEERTAIADASVQKIQSLLYTGTFGPGTSAQDELLYGLGTVRTLQQYEHEAGYCFRTQTATARARLGVLDGHSDSEFQDKHGVRAAQWKTAYAKVLEKNMLPLQGPPAPGTPMLSHRAYLQAQQRMKQPAAAARPAVRQPSYRPGHNA